MVDERQPETEKEEPVSIESLKKEIQALSERIKQLEDKEVDYSLETNDWGLGG